MPKIKRSREKSANKKIEELTPDISDMAGTTLTSNQGLAVNDDNNTLKAGERGPSLLEDFLMREKITHFDHERIPSARCMRAAWRRMATSNLSRPSRISRKPDS